MKWLIDTNVLSETIRLRPQEIVVSWLGQQPPEHTAISILTMAELRDGAASAAGDKRNELETWLEMLIVPSFGQRTLPLTTDILIEWIRMSRRLGAARMIRKATDLLLASTARIHNLTLVTRNTRDFANTGITVYNPWTDETQKMEAL